ncbi:uncharacterized protein MONBRDRAFT_29512 [Monosiga brevicollis MX1]|uniref:Presenilin n=1 Tax=Monosiga brevicollis TaxID=81824 RepID=A9VBA9_MONBE|nr:uncharacterized protein MONBRDRAFT_29512 [Monosiga brevicollis MX1]EDQ85205.1 predicted protein [Monosiga brevicollis MX1]|eukprot:XP_001750030.1 hypothetical protein [Monosiga brevicollis MX1]
MMMMNCLSLSLSLSSLSLSLSLSIHSLSLSLLLLSTLLFTSLFSNQFISLLSLSLSSLCFLTGVVNTMIRNENKRILHTQREREREREKRQRWLASLSLSLSLSLSHSESALLRRDRSIMAGDGSEAPEVASTNSGDPLIEHDRRTTQDDGRRATRPLDANVHERLLSAGRENSVNYTAEEREARIRARQEEAARRELELDLKYDAESVLALIKPVSACMIVVIATIRSITYFSQNDTQFAYTPFESNGGAGESSGERFGGAVLNALIVVGIVIVMTFILVMLYIYEYYKIIYGWLALSALLLLYFFSYQYIECVMCTRRQVLIAHNASIDWITMAFIIWNFGTVGFIAIFWRSPLAVQQVYLVIVSALMALVLIKNLPDWTTWVLLAAIAIYDLFAVLSPCGPLKCLVEVAQERNQPLFPSLIYSSTMMWTVTMADVGDSSSNSATIESQPRVADGGASTRGTEMTSMSSQPRARQGSRADSEADDGARDISTFAAPRGETRSTNQAAPASQPSFQPDDEDDSGVKLGLGDFIFYSVLVGKAATAHEWTTILACYVAILIGLACTLLLLSIFKKALPALPISIFFGLCFFFLTSEVLDPLIDRLNERQIFL